MCCYPTLSASDLLSRLWLLSNEEMPFAVFVHPPITELLLEMLNGYTSLIQAIS